MYDSMANAWFVKVNANTDIVRISAMVEAIIIIGEFVCTYTLIHNYLLYYQ